MYEYASPASLFCLPPRRRVTQEKNAPAGRGRLLVMLMQGGDAR
jgi:hypothetical protein